MTLNNHTRLAAAGILALAITIAAGMGTSPGAKTKKPKKTAVSFASTKLVGATIPDPGLTAGPSVPVRSSITLGKKFRNRVVTDVNVMFQSTGTLAGAASDLTFKLSAPNGRTNLLVQEIGDVSIGPLTLDEDNRTSICDSATATCRDPDATLLQPFAGRANTLGTGPGVRPLSNFNGVPMKGDWTITVFDSVNTKSSTFNRWRLEVKGVKAPS
jgi:Proprotein convertase P-domain